MSAARAGTWYQLTQPGIHNHLLEKMVDYCDFQGKVGDPTVRRTRDDCDRTGTMWYAVYILCAARSCHGKTGRGVWTSYMSTKQVS